MSKPYTRRSHRNSLGFSSIELLVAMAVTALGITLASSLMLAGRSHIREQQKELEASHAGRASLEAILRELRLGGACLPETGQFIALAATNSGDRDELITRFGITSPTDMSCVQTAVSAAVTAGSTTIPVDSTDDLSAGDLIYLRHTNGSGEYFIATAVDTSANTISADSALIADYPPTSGVYAVDERRFYIDEPTGSPPALMMQVDDGLATPFALGIEKLNVEYELSDGTRVDAPTDDQAWRSVRQIHISITSRSLKKSLEGDYVRREFEVGIKPRNLVDS